MEVILYIVFFPKKPCLFLSQEQPYALNSGTFGDSQFNRVFSHQFIKIDGRRLHGAAKEIKIYSVLEQYICATSLRKMKEKWKASSQEWKETGGNNESQGS